MCYLIRTSLRVIDSPASQLSRAAPLAPPSGPHSRAPQGASLASTYTRRSDDLVMALADATAVMPIDFTKLPFVALIAYLAFAEIPDLWTWIGAAVIFGASI